MLPAIISDQVKQGIKDYIRVLKSTNEFSETTCPINLSVLFFRSPKKNSSDFPQIIFLFRQDNPAWFQGEVINGPDLGE
jgi:hypothetical protein